MKEQTLTRDDNDCQLRIYPQIRWDGQLNKNSQLPVISRVRLFFRRHLDLEARRKIKRIFSLNNYWQPKIIRNNNLTGKLQLAGTPLDLKIGDTVRVRTREEILSTLDREGKINGCSFLGTMWQYCGTTHKVLKPVNRFVDERNYRIINTRGLVLLEDVMCSGTDFYGNCDRSCYFFWREEWLEKI